MNNNKQKIVFKIILIVFFAILFSYFYFGTSKQEGEIKQHQESTNWKVYSNKKYDFEIKFPNSWNMYEDFTTNSPIINFYPKGNNEEPPFNHFSTSPHVSIYPKGLPMGGVMGEQIDITNEQQIFSSVDAIKVIKFILNDNDAWAISAQFSNVPDSWESWGYLWSTEEIYGYEEVCVRDGEEISAYECNTFEGDQILRKGEINDSISEIISEMTKSFRFLD